MKTSTPRTISEPILRLCEELVPSNTPTYVPITPDPRANATECFLNVDAKVKREGGETVHGWAIWEWPGVMVEAEFHAVWRCPTGELVDITPTQLGVRRILFLIDTVRRYEGRQVNNVRRALVNDPIVHEFIAVANAQFRVLNRGERADQHAVALAPDEILPLVQRAQELQARLDSRTPGRNDPCVCGSGKKFKRCCG